MGVLRRASEQVDTVYLDDEKEDFLLLKSEVSKREFNRIAAAMPRSSEDATEMSLSEAMEFQGFLFDALVVGWSLSEGKPTLEDYHSLSAAAANAVDLKVAAHFEGLVPTSAEGK